MCIAGVRDAVPYYLKQESQVNAYMVDYPFFIQHILMTCVSLIMHAVFLPTSPEPQWAL